MKKLFVAAVVFVMMQNRSQAAFLLHNEYTYLQDITFELYSDDVPEYKIPELMKSIEETLMFDVLHAVWKDNHWVAYTLNKDLLGTYRVGQPALLDKGDVKKIFFIATFPGSFGGTDLYTAEYTNGKWGKPKNLGKSINTAGNESNPGLLTENILTYSSSGIIKKLDLTTLKVTDMMDASIASEKSVENNSNAATPTTPDKKKVEQKLIEETPKIIVSEEPKTTTKQEMFTASAKQIEETPKKEEVIASKAIAPVNNTIAPSVELPANSVQSLGTQTREAMLEKYHTAIQLGAFLSPKWDKIQPLSKYGKLITYKNENGSNVVWLTGFANRAAAESVLSQVKSVAGFENAYITGK